MKSVRRDTVVDKYSRLKANRIALTSHGRPEAAVADKLSTTELKIKKEIAIMKKLSHPNVVRLFEVIDDRMKEKVYMGTFGISLLLRPCTHTHASTRTWLLALCLILGE